MPRGAGQWKRKSHRFTLANDACKYSCSCSDLMEFSHWFHKWCKSTSEHRSLYVTTSFTICWLILNFIQGYFIQVVPQCEQLQTGLLPWKNGDLIGYDFSFSRVLCSRMFTRCPNHICICTIGIGRFFYLIYVEVYNYDTLKIEMNLVLWTCDWVISYMLYLWTSEAKCQSNTFSLSILRLDYPTPMQKSFE